MSTNDCHVLTPLSADGGAFFVSVSNFRTKAERDALAAEIRQRGIRRREFERFITTLESLPDQVTDFDETLWGSLAVYAKGDLRFMLACEVEITA